MELWGCDIDHSSVEWLRANLSPPLTVVPCNEEPPLDLPAAQFDLIYAISVFTHLTEHWSAWLLEMQRLLKPDGLLLATFHGAGVAHALDRLGWHSPYMEEQVGMHTIGMGTPWDEGGPSVIHSRWWILAHWGRLFETLSITPGPDGGHGFYVGRRRNVEVTQADLERLEPNEPREIEALQYSLKQTSAEVEVLRQAAVASAQQQRHP